MILGTIVLLRLWSLLFYSRARATHKPETQNTLIDMSFKNAVRRKLRIHIDMGMAAAAAVLCASLVQAATAGADFYRALLAAWLGEHAVQADLKRALLGER